MSQGAFHLPLFFEYGAAFLWATTGALIAARKGYDIAGLFALALITSAGGGLLRDGLFLKQGPPAVVRTPAFLEIAAAAALIILLFGKHVQKFRLFDLLVSLFDALGLGAYAVVGLQLSIGAGVSLPGATLIGVVNAVGGGMLRDVIIRKEPDIFKPGTLMATAALLGCFLYLLMTLAFHADQIIAAWSAILAVFTIRALSVRYNLKTKPVRSFENYWKDSDAS